MRNHLRAKHKAYVGKISMNLKFAPHGGALSFHPLIIKLWANATTNLTLMCLVPFQVNHPLNSHHLSFYTTNI